MSIQVPDQIICRPAVLADVQMLSALFRQVYLQTYATDGVSDELVSFMTPMFAAERLENTIKAYPDNLIVAVHKGNLVGVAEIAWNKQCPIDNIVTAEINKLYIFERFCRMGIGQQLMTAAEKVIAGKELKQVWLWVLESNERAISFYEKIGYKWIGNAPFFTHINRYENKVMLKDL